jgi:hypothetical protein
LSVAQSYWKEEGSSIDQNACCAATLFKKRIAEFFVLRHYSREPCSVGGSAAASAVTRPTTLRRIVFELILANARLRSRPSFVAMKPTSSGAAADAAW